MEVDRILDDEALYLRCQRIQPILGGGTQPSHFEVLLGVRGADGRDLSTPEFIEAAERYHRMPEVDRWVIRTAFRWIAENQDGLHQVDGFSINLSGRSLNDAGLLQFIMEEMETTGVPTHKLCFEVTETVGVASLSETADFIREIKKAGCKFSLDDFGSGMSSYAYLRHLPVDFLKIDGAFVKDMANNPFDAAVVKSICEIGHFMDKKVIAEYVENDAILEQLRALGVDCAQGYGIEKPIAMRDLTSLLSSNHKH
jgi:EAL domain-containing protein (putative c-di-GMP-specific phosphodiesterase class I)